MAFLVGLAIFSAALLHPFGRKLLLTMLCVVATPVVLYLGLWGIGAFR